MKTVLRLAAMSALLLGASSPSFAGGTVTVPRGAHVGPQSVSGPGTSTYINNGTISGGSSPGLTVTGSPSPSVTNNGTITSNTTGVSISGGSSSSLTNNGTISATNTSNGGTASATGVSQSSSGP